MENLNNILSDEVNTIKVSSFSTTYSRANGIELPMYLVQISPTSNEELIYIKNVLQHIITWEKLKKNEIMQCKRCQRLGHAATNCKLKYRCVKCKGQHGTGECPSNNLDKETLYCINCNSYGHPAAYRGCSIIIEFTSRMRSRIREQIVNMRDIAKNSGSTDVTGSSYANVIRGKSSNNKNSNTNIRNNVHSTNNNCYDLEIIFKKLDCIIRF